METERRSHPLLLTLWGPRANVSELCVVCRQAENAGYELERLYTDVTSLCSRIELLPCSSARDRLAQSGETRLGGREHPGVFRRFHLLSRYQTPPSPTDPRPFSPAEMAKRVANILRVVLSLQQGDASSDSLSLPLAQLAPHIARLPMPEDYTLEELRGLTQSYLRQLVVSQ